MGVNLFGVANGLRSFVPRMIEQGEGHIVNTGSGASFVATPRLGPYCATKHAIVGLSEALRYELDGTGIGVSVLVPAGVNTNIADAWCDRRPIPTTTAADFAVLVGALDPTSLEMIEPDVVADVTHRRREGGLGLHRDGSRPGGRCAAPLRRGPRRAPPGQGALPVPALTDVRRRAPFAPRSSTRSPRARGAPARAGRRSRARRR